MCGMVVLSLFDGMSCGQIALRELGVVPRKYYASEINHHAIAQTWLNFPDTEQLGDVREVDVRELERIDLLLGGSPCQSFSFAGKRQGMAARKKEDGGNTDEGPEIVEICTLDEYLRLKNDGFVFEGESYLFWEYMRILTDIRRYSNPDVRFLLENVEMGRKWERVLSEAIGVRGVHINSALVSAQNRRRIYWTNIRTRREGLFGELCSDIPQPEDRGILLRDILETGPIDGKYSVSAATLERMGRRTDPGSGAAVVPERYYLSDEGVKYVTDPERLRKKLTAIDGEKAICLMEGYTSWNGTFIRDDTLCISSGQTHAAVAVNKRTPIVSAMGMGGGHVPMIVQRARGKNRGGRYGRKTPAMSANAWQENNLVIQLNPDRSFGNQPRQQDRYYSPDGKSPALNTLAGGNLQPKIVGRTAGTVPDAEDDRDMADRKQECPGNIRIRRLTPLECVRLQTVPDWYRWQCSDTQIYKLLGNGWTIAVIVHILRYFVEDWRKGRI